MKVNLNSRDMVEIAKALKSGCLDLSKVERLRQLVEGYNPRRPITRRQMEYYLDCLYKAVGYVPNSKDYFIRCVENIEGLDLSGKDLGETYKQMVRYIFLGMVCVRALGGVFENVEADFSFCESIPDFEI